MNRSRAKLAALLLYGLYVVVALFIKDPRTKIALMVGGLIPLTVIWSADRIGRLAESVVKMPHGEENLGQLLFILGWCALVVHGSIIFWKLLR